MAQEFRRADDASRYELHQDGALVGVLEGLDVEVNHAKVAVKLLIGLVILVLVMVNLRKDRIPNGLWAGLLLLSVANVCVAVLWSPAHAA